MGGLQTILVTGGCGFIGSHLVRHLVNKYFDRYLIVNVDKLTYAGNPANNLSVAHKDNYLFRQADIVDITAMQDLFAQFQFDFVIHLAAESHVDRSIAAPAEFVMTNVVGTTNLLQCARQSWQDSKPHLFYHVSTDEVYGSLGETGQFHESSAYAPRSPYSASKAASDHLVRSFQHTYGLPTVISNCSNNYGPHQFPEKLIPTCISRLLARQPIPVYGDGQNVRDWLYVEDHIQAIDLIFHSRSRGGTYNVGGDCEVRNLDLVQQICDCFDQAQGLPPGTSQKLISFVEDRAGHDYRYAVDCSRLKEELGWTQSTRLCDGLRSTLGWYLANPQWFE